MVKKLFIILTVLLLVLAIACSQSPDTSIKSKTEEAEASRQAEPGQFKHNISLSLAGKLSLARPGHRCRCKGLLCLSDR
ncbi:MAG: hypothetical protein U5N58_11735 [Actinomycetota bacterium]|nr:hypothetical protein [Actinomycetota bacterium]